MGQEVVIKTKNSDFKSGQTALLPKSLLSVYEVLKWL